MVYYSSSVAKGLKPEARETRKRYAQHRGIAQLVEQRSPKPRAEGSNPSSPASFPERMSEKLIDHKISADLAHLVERDLAKVEVAGSSPVIRSSGCSHTIGAAKRAARTKRTAFPKTQT